MTQTFPIPSFSSCMSFKKKKVSVLTDCLERLTAAHTVCIFIMFLTIWTFSCTVDYSVLVYAQVNILVQSFSSTYYYFSIKKYILKFQSKLLPAFRLLSWKPILPGGTPEIFQNSELFGIALLHTYCWH